MNYGVFNGFVMVSNGVYIKSDCNPALQEFAVILCVNKYLFELKFFANLEILKRDLFYSEKRDV